MNNSQLDLLGAPSDLWAMTQDAMDELQRVAAAVRFENSPDGGHGGLRPLSLPESFLRHEVRPPERRYEVINGDAVLPLYGIITKRETFWSRYFGGTSADAFRRDFHTALDDDDVRRILFDVESPGGQIAGVSQCSNDIYESRGQKPIIAVANEMMASAAVWIGTAADEVITLDTAMLGSVGVIRYRHDYTKWNSERGIAEHQIKSGELKGIGDPNQPMSEAERDHWQSQVDFHMNLFVAAVARNRGMSEQQVIENMGDARLFIGQQAVDAGLADRVGTLDAELVSEETDTHFHERLQTNAHTKLDNSSSEQHSERGRHYGPARFIRRRR